MTDRKDVVTREQFMAELYRYKKGSVTRRHFLGVTGLGLATSVLGAAMPGLRSAAHAQTGIGDRVVVASWPNYHDAANCSIPDDHIDPRRSALFMARSVLREVRDGDATC